MIAKEALRAFEQLNGARVIEKNMRTGTEKIIKERVPIMEHKNIKKISRKYDLLLRSAILQIKRKKAPFFIKKNDYKCMSAAAEQLLSHARN